MLETLIPLAIITLSLDSHNSAAATTAGRAYIRQNGMERMIQDYEERTFSKELRARVGTAAWITKTITEQKITVEWRF